MRRSRSSHRFVLSSVLSIVTAGAMVVSAAGLGACSDSQGGSTSQDVGVDGLDLDVIGGDVAPGVPVEVETTADTTTVAAGGVVTITCSAKDSTGAVVELTDDHFVLQVAPPDGVSADGKALTLTKTGTVTAACKLDDPSIADQTPVELTVTPGAAAATAAALEPTQTTAGEAATVTCTVTDEFGNETADAATVQVEPADGVTVDGTAVTGNKAGELEVTCAVAGVATEAQAGATWTVVAAAPKSFELAFTPDKKSYAVGAPVLVSGVGEDAYGNLVEGLEVTDLAASPAGNETIIDETRIRFDTEAIYTVSAKLASDTSLSASRELVVDQTPPTIALKSPARGLVKDVETSVSVEGTVNDNLGKVLWLKLNGEDLPVPPEGGSFQKDVALGYGLNLLLLSASDPYDLIAEIGRAVEWSATWYAMGDPDADPPVPATVESDGVDQGLDVMLSQEFVDDGDHDPSHLNDLATILMVALDGMDMAALLPDPLGSFPCIGGDCEARITSVTFDSSSISLALIQDGIKVQFGLTNITMDLELVAPCTWDAVCQDPTITLPGTVKIASVDFESDILLSLVDGAAEASATNTVIDIGDVMILIEDPTGGWLNDIINQGYDYIEPWVTGAIEAILPPFVEGFIGDAVNQLFDALTLSQQIDLPPIVQGDAPNTLSIETAPSDLKITPFSMEMSIDTLAHAVNPMPPYPHPGSLQYASCGPIVGLPVPPTSPLTLGLHDDLINQLLYAVWDGGTLAIQKGADDELAFDMSSVPITIDSLVVDPLLPPVFNSCNADGQNRLQLGDLAVDISADLLGQPTTLKLWLQAEAPVELSAIVNEAGNTAIGFSVGEFDPMVIEIVTNVGAFEGDDQGVIDLFKTAILPMVMDQLSGLSFEIPAIDLSALSPAIPAGTNLTLDLQSFGRSGAYVMAQGALK